jgi:hypothetical protein
MKLGYCQIKALFCEKLHKLALPEPPDPQNRALEALEWVSAALVAMMHKMTSPEWLPSFRGSYI